MHEVIDDKLDLVIFIVILTLVVSYGVVPSINTYVKAKRQQKEIIQDKNTMTFKGYGYTESDFDSKYSLYDVMLLLQSQDYSMPEPRTVKVMDNNNVVYGIIKMENNYRENLLDIANEFKSYAIAIAGATGKNINNMKFALEYRKDLFYDGSGKISSTDEYFALICGCD